MAPPAGTPVLAATADPAFARVELEVTYALGDADTATVTCTPPSGHERVVRALAGIPVGAAFGYDDEPELEVALSYTCVVSNEDGDSAESTPVIVTVAYQATWLKNVALPSVNMILPIVEGIPALTSEARHTAHHVAGRPFPVVISDVRQGHTGTLTAVTETDDQKAALNALLATGDVLLFQGDVGEGHLYMLATTVNESRISRIYSEPGRRWDIEFIECEAPLSPLVTEVAGRTYQGVLDTWASYSTVSTVYETYLDLLRGTTV